MMRKKNATFLPDLNFVCFFVSAAGGRYEHTHFPCRREVHLLLFESEILLAIFECDVFGNSFGEVDLVFLWNWVEIEQLKVHLHLRSHFRQVFVSVYFYVLHFILSASCVCTECFLHLATIELGYWLGICFMSCCKCAKYAQKIMSTRKYLTANRLSWMYVWKLAGIFTLWILMAGKGHIMIVSHRGSRCLQLLRLMTGTWCKERRSCKILGFRFVFSP